MSKKVVQYSQPTTIRSRYLQFLKIKEILRLTITKYINCRYYICIYNAMTCKAY